MTEVLPETKQSSQTDGSADPGHQAAPPEKSRVHHDHWSLTEELAGDRNRMASERTLMGWIRTSLAMISFGFGLVKFFDFLRHAYPQDAYRLGVGPEYVGQFLLLFGTFLILGAAIAHWRRLTLIDRGEVSYRSRFSLGLLVSLILFVLGALTLILHYLKI